MSRRKTERGVPLGSAVPRLLVVAWAGVASGSALAAAPYSCGGFALLGGAQIVCTHTDAKAPAQICTFSWALTTTAGTPTVASGSFLLVPGAVNASVYQGSGFSGELSGPIVLCQGKRSS